VDLDPDPNSESVSGSGARRVKISHKNRKLKNLMFEVLDVLFWGLKAAVPWTSFMEA
jgi:hypothetical protein